MKGYLAFYIWLKMKIGLNWYENISKNKTPSAKPKMINIIYSRKWKIEMVNIQEISLKVRMSFKWINYEHNRLVTWQDLDGGKVLHISSPMLELQEMGK